MHSQQLSWHGKDEPFLNHLLPAILLQNKKPIERVHEITRICYLTFSNAVHYGQHLMRVLPS